MKIYNKSFLKKVGVTLLGVALVGCDSFLDELPDGRTELNSEEKIYELLGNAYTQGSSMAIAETMSDNAGNKIELAENNILNADLYHWRDNNQIGQDTPSFVWEMGYSAIAAANQALESADAFNLPKNSPVRGEALVARAFAHFELAILWAKPYNEATAQTDLGLVYVTEAEKVVYKKYKRISLKEYYDLIEKDLLEGIPLIKDGVYKQPKFHFTKAAANAFASRFYLAKGDWQKVVKHATEALGTTGVEKKLRNVNDDQKLGRSYEARRRQYSSSSEPANLLISSSISNYTRNFATSKYGLTTELATHMESRNFHPSNGAWAYQIYGRENSRNIPRILEYFRITNPVARTGYPYLMSVLLSNDEVLLNRIEANIMLGNYSEAINDLNVYLPLKTNGQYTPLTQESVNRKYAGQGADFSPNYPIDDTQKAWVKCVTDLRRWEFLHLGIRWFDNKRLGMEVVHQTQDGQTITLTKDDPRRELQIPNDATAQGIVPNPR